jgi:hypothetical protein
MKFRWPRGRYNGRRITGLKIAASIDFAHFEWKPVMAWKFWTYIFWLWFGLRFEIIYHD